MCASLIQETVLIRMYMSQTLLLNTHMHISQLRETLHKHAIRRSGMPFGPEVSDEEAASGITALNPDGSIPRGLAFMCYQSSIQDGFEFLQEGSCLAHDLRRYTPNVLIMGFYL